jgi:oligopeptide/dipeptide ABC transporter ATP-binding protein
MAIAIEDLTICYGRADAPRAVDGVSLRVGAGASFGLIGESGCGKSTLALAILDLLPAAAFRLSGEIRINGTRPETLAREAWRRRRWTEIAYVPQGAIAAFDPVSTLYRQFEQTAKAHGGLPRLRARAEELFRQVELDPAWLDRYPHQLSGGMRQRAAIALALLLDPSILVADEPTTGLDVLVQREIIDLLRQTRLSRGLTLVLVSHDLGVVGELCTELAVMYAGRIVEQGSTADLLRRPVHPYTMGLRNAFGDPGQPFRFPVGIPGSLPVDPPRESCGFASRCPFALDTCAIVRPELTDVAGRKAACHRSGEAAALLAASTDASTWIASGAVA